MRRMARISRWILVAFLTLGSAGLLVAQGSYRAQVRGVITDASGAVVR